MKFFGVLALTFLAITYVTATPSPKQILPTSRLPQSVLDELKKEAEGCNANVCFAIDGSGSIGHDEFTAEVQMVQDIISIIADGTKSVKIAANQFGSAVLSISSLTINPADVILALENTDQIKGASFVTGGINFCFRELFREEHDANKIVVLSDGFENVGSSAVARADLFRKTVKGGLVCAVAGSSTNDYDTLEGIAGGNSSLVFRVNFLDALAIEQVIRDLVKMICTPKET